MRHKLHLGKNFIFLNDVRWLKQLSSHVRTLLHRITLPRVRYDSTLLMSLQVLKSLRSPSSFAIILNRKDMTCHKSKISFFEYDKLKLKNDATYEGMK